jgi:Na+-driven multidrug efflux pump
MQPPPWLDKTWEQVIPSAPNHRSGKIGFYNMVFLVLVSVVYFLYNESIMGIFTDNLRMRSIGAEWLKILFYSYIVYGWWMVSVQAFNGAGDTKTPTKINLVFFWMIQIPLSYYLAITLG